MFDKEFTRYELADMELDEFEALEKKMLETKDKLNKGQLRFTNVTSQQEVDKKWECFWRNKDLLDEVAPIFFNKRIVIERGYGNKTLYGKPLEHLSSNMVWETQEANLSETAYSLMKRFAQHNDGGPVEKERWLKILNDPQKGLARFNECKQAMKEIEREVGEDYFDFGFIYNMPITKLQEKHYKETLITMAEAESEYKG
jgi:hypothetical protein